LKYIIIISKPIVAIISKIWNFIFIFFGITYEKQAKEVDFENLDPLMRGPENEKSTHKIYRANKVSKKD